MPNRRADQVPPEDIAAEAIRLRKRVDELEARLSELSEGPPPGSELLMQGSDTIGLEFNVALSPKEGQQAEESKPVTITTTYNEVLRGIAKVLLESPSEYQIASEVAATFRERVLQSLGVSHADRINVFPQTMEGLRIQFRALGIATQTKETRERVATSGMQSYSLGSYSFFKWTLTPYGDRIVTQLLAKRRDG